MNEKPKSIDSWLTIAGRYLNHVRNAALIVVPSLYAFGALVWSLHAANYRLGPLPLADTQYFNAGIPVAVIIGFGIATVLAVRAGRGRIKLWLAGPRRNWARSLFRRGWFSYVIVLVILWQWLKLDAQPSAVWAGMALLPSLWVMDFTDPEARVMHAMSTFHSYFIPLFLVITSLAIYVYVIFPVVPQEIGGARPRCAQFDLVPDQLSQSTRQELLPTGVRSEGSSLVRSEPVAVFFETESFVLMRTIPGSMDAAPHNLYKIRTAEVHNIMWCDH
jgi:hypothetical protein